MHSVQGQQIDCMTKNAVFLQKYASFIPKYYAQILPLDSSHGIKGRIWRCGMRLIAVNDLAYHNNCDFKLIATKSCMLLDTRDPTTSEGR